MSTEPQRYEVISVSLPQALVRRADALIPRTRRSKVVRELLAAFIDSVERKKIERAYAAYYARRSPREAQQERDLLAEWKLADDEAWAILERAEARGGHQAR